MFEQFVKIALPDGAGVSSASAVVPSWSEDGGGGAGRPLPWPGGRPGQPHLLPVPRPHHHPAAASAQLLIRSSFIGWRGIASPNHRAALN